MAATQRETIDFTVMYATHDAFRRDLGRLLAAVSAGRAQAPEVRAGWENFKHQLHIHHTVEDSDLWPRVEAAVDDPEYERLLAEMEEEHAQLGPLLDAVDQAFAMDPDALPGHVKRLADLLGDHMRHEEEEALPLIQEACTAADWRAFSGAMRRAQGLSGAAVYLPWIVDGTPPEDRRRFLNAMPPPARALNRLLWEPRYRKRHLFQP